MTESEAIEKLRAYHKCQRLQVKGIYEDCNEHLCDNCDLCYAQGNTGEHIKSIEIAINELAKQVQKKPRLKHDVSVMHINRGNQPHEWKRLESDNWHCPECDSFVGERVYVHSKVHDQRKKKYCDNCGQKLDWSDEDDD